ncbi:hypothetical protein BSKO_00244 [Bryopsis sp. KO-2023]|nr:hypothetical protein BSKO_00244 [Bryopsis sp. KO-2023]
MAKRSKPDSESESDGGSQMDSEMEMGDSAGEGEADEELSDVEADFEFFDPQERDFHGLKALLNNYLDGGEFNCGELVDAIIQQSRVGTVLKCGEDGSPIGVASVLNFQHYKQLVTLSTVKSFILNRCTNAEEKKKLHSAMESGACGLLVNERLLNCPPQLGPPLQQALFDEIQWATEDEPTEELRNSFKFTQYVVLTRAFRDPTMEEAREGKQAKKGHSKKSKSSGPTGLIYVRPEDEFFHQFCNLWFTFPVENACTDEVEPLRLVMLMQASQVTQARAALDAVVGNAAAENE